MHIGLSPINTPKSKNRSPVKGQASGLCSQPPFKSVMKYLLTLSITKLLFKCNPPTPYFICNKRGEELSTYLICVGSFV